MKGQETAAETRQVIAGLMSRHDTASNGRFQRRNRAVLDQMRDGDRDAWNTVQLRLGDHDANCASAARDRRKQ
jgi:hypothetical protein